MFIPAQYKLKGSSIYWHKLYFDIVPDWMINYGPPLGNYNYAAYLYRPHKYVIDVCKRIKWFIQRGHHGYADCDVWSIDCYLCDWMPKALAALKKNKQGHPVGISKKKWDEKLDRMISAFKVARKIQDYDYKTAEEMQQAVKQFRKDFNLVKIHFFSLWA